MMALSGVRISWLILARKSDKAAEAFSAWRACPRKLGNRGLRALQRRARIVRGDFGGMVLGRLIRRGLIERRFRAGRRRAQGGSRR